MSTPRIGIVIGTTRQGRFADKPTQWIHSLASKRADLGFELIDLRDYPLPFFDEPASPSTTPPKNEIARKWAAKLAQCDGFIFVTAEYNHGPPAVLKNALDYAYKEFNRKPVAFVGYGSTGASRAVQQLRLNAATLQMVPLGKAVHIGMVEFLGVMQQGKRFDDYPHLEQSAIALFDDLAWWSRTLRTAREAT